jgi:hypothetical protein
MNDGDRQARKADWSLSQGNELDAVSPSPLCSNADRPQREPVKDWRQGSGSHAQCDQPLGRAAAPTFFWGGKAAKASGKASPFA